MRLGQPIGQSVERHQRPVIGSASSVGTARNGSSAVTHRTRIRRGEALSGSIVAGIRGSQIQFTHDTRIAVGLSGPPVADPVAPIDASAHRRRARSVHLQVVGCWIVDDNNHRLGGPQDAVGSNCLTLRGAPKCVRFGRRRRQQ